MLNKKVLLLFIASFFLFSCGKDDSININNLNNNPENKKEVVKIDQNKNNNLKYSIMSVSDRIKANCNSFEDPFEKTFCIENQPTLKNQQFFSDYSKKSTEKLVECNKFDKKIAYSGALSEATKCRIKVIINSGRKDPQNKINDEKLNCSSLSKYKEIDVCKKTLDAIKKYSEYKNVERIYNELFGIR